MSWLTDTGATGKRMQHVDGEQGTVLSVHGEFAEVKWDDGSTSKEHETFLTYV